MEFSKPHLYRAVVESLIQIAPKIYVATLRQRGELMMYSAGQYGSFIIDAKTRRNFSFALAPNGEVFEICADVTPLGPGSIWLMNLDRGQEVTFLGPLGRFTVDHESPNRRVFVATGTGIAPIRAMIYDALTKDLGKETILYFGLRHEEDIFWDDEFSKLAKTYPQFRYHLTLSQPSSNWEGKRGRVTDHLFNHDNLEQCDFYLCGSRDMVREMTDRLIESNIEEVQIKTELFY